jgi:hypothetical protein
VETEQQTMTTEAIYLVWAQPDANQAESLANYLTRHGVEAVAAENEVTCPVEHLSAAAHAFALRSHWRLFWRYSEKELYGMPCYHKPACVDHLEQG